GDELLHHELPINHDLCKNIYNELRIELDSDRTPCVTCKDKMSAAKTYYWLTSLGHDVSIDCVESTYEISYSVPYHNPNAIEEIILLDTTPGFVYDLETYNHHFSAGIGKMI